MPFHSLLGHFTLDGNCAEFESQLCVLQIGCLQVMRIECKIYFLRLICKGCFRMQINMDFENYSSNIVIH